MRFSIAVLFMDVLVIHLNFSTYFNTLDECPFGCNFRIYRGSQFILNKFKDNCETYNDFCVNVNISGSSFICAQCFKVHLHCNNYNRFYYNSSIVIENIVVGTV